MGYRILLPQIRLPLGFCLGSWITDIILLLIDYRCCTVPADLGAIDAIALCEFATNETSGCLKLLHWSYWDNVVGA